MSKLSKRSIETKISIKIRKQKKGKRRADRSKSLTNTSQEFQRKEGKIRERQNLRNIKDISPQIQEAKEPKTKEVRGNLHPDRHGDPSEHSGPRPRAATEVGPQARSAH